MFATLILNFTKCEGVYLIRFSSVIYKEVSWNPCGEDVHGSKKNKKLTYHKGAT